MLWDVRFAILDAKTCSVWPSGCIQGAMPVAMAELFPARLRYSAMAIGYNITLAIFGGTAPLIATWLIKTTGNLAAPAWYLVAIAAITFTVTMAIRPHRESEATPTLAADAAPR